MVREDGATVRVIAGEHGGARGPVTGIVADPTYLDVALEPDAVFEHPAPSERTGFAYVFGGTAAFGMAGELVGDCHAVRLGAGDAVLAEAGPDGGRFLLVAGQADRRARGLARAGGDEHGRGARARPSASSGKGRS